MLYISVSTVANFPKKYKTSPAPLSSVNARTISPTHITKPRIMSPARPVCGHDWCNLVYSEPCCHHREFHQQNARSSTPSSMATPISSSVSSPNAQILHRRDPFSSLPANPATADGHAPSSSSISYTHPNANGHTPDSNANLPDPTRTFRQQQQQPPPPDPAYSPGGVKSLSGISARAFVLGLCLGTSLPLTLLALLSSSALWRVPFFLSTLCLFHFLEYWTTACYNPSTATTSAFLLSQNGSAYNVAHTMAFVEVFLREIFFPGKGSWGRVWGLPKGWDRAVLGVGFAMLILGQVTRTMAMAHAGSNFNHLVQMKKKQGHELVTDGIYAWLRHPSYFGFWWWGLGTQVVLGNWVCLGGYAFVVCCFFILLFFG